MENLGKVNYEKIFADTYRGKKILLTGHTGFKGSWLLTWLHSLGAKVKGYALSPLTDGLYNLIEGDTLCESIIADIRDKQKLRESIAAFSPDFIFHLAAQPLVRLSYEIPAETFDVNVTGTASLLECVRSLQNKCTVIIVTTDKVYANKESGHHYKETDILGGYDPYSASKACTEIVVDSFRSSFFNDHTYHSHRKAIASARAGNVIGGGDRSKDRIIPDIVRSLESKEVVVVRNPRSVRPWQHVLEPLSGYLLLGSLLDTAPADFSGAYNFGPFAEDHLTVQSLVETAIDCWGEGEWKQSAELNQPHEAGLLHLNLTKAMEQLGWKPKLNSKEAIQWTIDWYRENRSDAFAFSMQQIENYCRR